MWIYANEGRNPLILVKPGFLGELLIYGLGREKAKSASFSRHIWLGIIFQLDSTAYQRMYILHPHKYEIVLGGIRSEPGN
jgi:hypothetical protein